MSNKQQKRIKSTSQFLTCRSMQKNWCFLLGSLLSNYSHLGSIIKICLRAKSLDGTIQAMEVQSHLMGKNNRQLSQRVCGCRYWGKGLFPESVPHHECECSSVSFCPQNCPVSVDSICAKDFCFLCGGVCCSVALWDPRDCSTPGFPVLHYLLEFTQTHVHWVSHAIQPSHPLPPPSPPALSLSQHRSIFQGASSSHQVAKVFAFKMQENKILWVFYLNLSNAAY